MCGIAGIISLQNRTVFSDNIANMTEVLGHRGPDDIDHALINGGNAAVEFSNVSDLNVPEHSLSSYGIGFG